MACSWAGAFMPVAVHPTYDRPRHWPGNCFHVVVAATAGAGRRGWTTAEISQLTRIGITLRGSLK